ncbi:MAG: DUF2235 domain-containing protein [Oceanicaulis sp.]
MKHLIVCCDGTWQSLAQDMPTNVALLAMHLAPTAADGRAQIVYYDSGVGAGVEAAGAGLLGGFADRMTRLLGGAAGHGVEAKIFAAYRFLATNYAPGDALFVFGFSRGAFIARSLCGMMYASGLLSRSRLARIGEAYALYRSDVKPDDPAARAFRRENGARPKVSFLGCFDTVAMNGAPNLVDALALDRLLNRGRGFHDVTVNRLIARARHACALDEERKLFPLTPMAPPRRARTDQVVEMWFPGHHGGVGGGEGEARPFSDAALLWMAEEAEAAGLRFDPWLKRIAAPDPLAPMARPDALRRAGTAPRMLYARPEEARLHDSVAARYHARPDWRPPSLAPLRAMLEAERA